MTYNFFKKKKDDLFVLGFHLKKVNLFLLLFVKFKFFMRGESEIQKEKERRKV